MQVASYLVTLDMPSSADDAAAELAIGSVASSWIASHRALTSPLSRGGPGPGIYASAVAQVLLPLTPKRRKDCTRGEARAGEEEDRVEASTLHLSHGPKLTVPTRGGVNRWACIRHADQWPDWESVEVWHQSSWNRRERTRIIL